MPSEKTSLRRSIGRPHACSGAHVEELAAQRPPVGVRGLGRGLGDAEVHELHLALERDQDVLGADVAVHDLHRPPLLVLLAVGVLEGGADLAHHAQAQVEGHAQPLLPRALHDRAQVAAVDVLHRDVVALLDPPEVEDLHDARVGEARHHLGLVDEHVEELLVVGEVGQDALQRHDLLEALDARPLRLEDLGHAADRHAVEELVGPEAVVPPRRLARGAAPRAGAAPPRARRPSPRSRSPRPTRGRARGPERDPRVGDRELGAGLQRRGGQAGLLVVGDRPGRPEDRLRDEPAEARERVVHLVVRCERAGTSAGARRSRPACPPGILAAPEGWGTGANGPGVTGSLTCTRIGPFRAAPAGGPGAGASPRGSPKRSSDVRRSSSASGPGPGGRAGPSCCRRLRSSLPLDPRLREA